MTTSDPEFEPLRKTILVQANVDRAFRVFTDEFDTWWPRTHHIGKSPMKKAIIEGRAGGRCYTEQEDGTECSWGTVLVWEPPRRFVMAWQITHEWGYEPDLAKSSEVEIRFTPETDGSTRIDLEHRHFERHGPNGKMMRHSVSAPNGWAGILQLYKNQINKMENLS